MNTPARILGAAPAAAARFTASEFLRMAECGAFDGMKVELVEGVLDRMNPPLSNHAWLQASVIAALWPVARRQGLVVLGEAAIDLGTESVRTADVVVVRALPSSRRPLRPDEIALVIEIAETTLARDTGPKRIAYATAGILSYWVVDGERSVTHVYTDPTNADYASTDTVPFGAALTVPGTSETIVVG